MKVQLTIPSATRRFDLQKGCFYTCVPSAIERRQRELGSKRGRGFESLGRYRLSPHSEHLRYFLRCCDEGTVSHFWTADQNP